MSPSNKEIFEAGEKKAASELKERYPNPPDFSQVPHPRYQHDQPLDYGMPSDSATEEPK